MAIAADDNNSSKADHSVPPGRCFCCPRLQNPKNDPLDWALLGSLAIMIVGFVLVMLAWVTPRDDPWTVGDNGTVDARKAEQMEESYYRLSNLLNKCTMAGIILVGCSVLFLASVTAYYTCGRDICPLCVRKSHSQEDFMVLTSSGAQSAGQYGSTLSS